MRYAVTTTGHARIWPHTLPALTEAIKHACKLSTQVDTVVTLSIHDVGYKVPFRKFKGGQEVWRQESAED
jgi:hypothetical protein